ERVAAYRPRHVADEVGRPRDRLLVLLEDRPERVVVPTSRVLVIGPCEQDPQQALRAVEAAPEVVALTPGSAQERAEVPPLGADQLLVPGVALDGDPVRVARAQAGDLDVVALAGLAQRLHRIEEHVPEREAEVADEEVPTPVVAPALGELQQADVEVGGEAREALLEVGAKSR